MVAAGYIAGMKTTAKGDVGLGLVMADLLKRGFPVALPLGEGLRYDLIVDKDDELLRVQCKASTSKAGALVVKCRSTSSWAGKTRATHKYTAKDIDLLAAVDLTTSEVYYIPASQLGDGLSELKLRLTPPKNGQVKGIRWAKDYSEP